MDLAGKQVVFSVEESLRKLGKSLENIAPRVEKEINQAVSDMVEGVYANMVAKAQAELTSTRAAYLDGLRHYKLGDNEFIISLEGRLASDLEDGWASYNMSAKMLASDATVSAGSRAGEKWVQHTVPQKKGEPSHRFAHVPFERKPMSKAAGTSNLADAIKSMTAVNASGRDQKITRIFKDISGNAIEGKVAVGKSDNPILNNLVKYQSVSTDKSGKQRVTSTYLNYRTISDNGRPWIHPGFSGLRAFDEAEKDIPKSIEQILSTLL